MESIILLHPIGQKRKPDAEGIHLRVGRFGESRLTVEAVVVDPRSPQPQVSQSYRLRLKTGHKKSAPPGSAFLFTNLQT
ncbi:hypothetical protein LX69_02557 [Breznakibacter xylanolyticus]|uniref:Uncharacterized protein n=1 Tax=Breznakibacter xylanolyticus TaxID=990 RepID=A0A2W7PVU9_9BACT|nr:hypothetical protein LX69_02557 [Breznakibacter xylanolyticus]